MSITTDESTILTQLRAKAEEQLQTGTTRRGGHWSLGTDALRMLHQLSSNSESAGDALKLLHELQVHQVELDLQNEQMATNEQSLVDDLSLYRELYDSAPVGIFLVEPSANIVQGNAAAAHALGLDQYELAGRCLDAFLLAPSRPLLQNMLKRVSQSGDSDACVAEMSPSGQDSGQVRYVRFTATRCSAHERIIVACCEC